MVLISAAQTYQPKSPCSTHTATQGQVYGISSFFFFKYSFMMFYDVLLQVLKLLAHPLRNHGGCRNEINYLGPFRIKDLSGWWYTNPSEKYEVSWDDDIPKIWKVIKVMFQTTNQLWGVEYEWGMRFTTTSQVATPTFVWRTGCLALPFQQAFDVPRSRKPLRRTMVC